MPPATAHHYTRCLHDLGSDDAGIVGGKNAALGELIRHLKDQGVRVPDGFATTADAYWQFLENNGLSDQISPLLDALHGNDKKLQSVGKSIRKLFSNAEFPDETKQEIRDAYRELCHRANRDDLHVAVRSSATAEDLP